ncbi:MAG: DUF6268 family outer membrane beta-barrel protein [Bacteroidetes bacterium]|jgi:hypothetical protein|nr:DUF6268 family outer membrane beta-barrel protein [Bacteroidota bacterium]
MRYLLLLMFFLINLTAFTQVKPDFFPEDINPEAIGVRCFCKPGIRNKSRSRGITFEYGFIGDGVFEPENDTLTRPYSSFNRIEQLELNVKVPLVNREKIKVLLGYKHYRETFRFEEVGVDYSDAFQELANRKLKSNSFSVIISKPINETSYFATRFRYTTNGDYEGLIKFENKYSIYKFIGLYGFKPNDDIEWGFGLSVASGFRGKTALPFFLYNRNFNEKWGIESVLPGFVHARYNINQRSILLGGFEYSSQSYRLDATETSFGLLDYAFNHSEMLISIRWERQIAEWFWSTIKFGYQLNFSSDFESKSVITPAFNVEPTNNWFIKIGIFLAPPDSVLK